METPDFSIEFFPPKTPEGAEKLRIARAKLAELNPKYFSVTFGAGGSTQQGTLATVREIQAAGHEAALRPDGPVPPPLGGAFRLREGVRRRTGGFRFDRQGGVLPGEHGDER